MDAQQFLAAFGYIANAPGGVARLREMVLDLAVRGELCHRDFEWCEKSLKDIGDWAIGSGFPKQEQGHSGNSILFVKVSDMNLPENQKFIVKTNHTITESTATRLRIKVHPPGTVVFPKIGGAISTNKRRILTRPTAIDNNCLGLIPKGEATTEWLYLVLSSIDFSKYQAGTSVPALSQVTLARIPCFLPSRVEQSRIVAKVNELMALCDRLETQQQERRKLQNALRQSTLQAMASAASPHELQEGWKRLRDSLGELFTEPGDVEGLRKLIVELSIFGLLDVEKASETDQNLEEYLSELFQKKIGKRVAKTSAANIGIALPDGWRWVLLEDLLADSESGWSPKCDAEPRSADEWGVLKVSAVTWGFFDPEENKRLPTSLENRPEIEVKPGDFLLSRANTAELVARSVIAPDDCPRKLIMSDKIIRLNFLDDLLKPWVNLVNNSDMARNYYKERATGTSDSMRNVSRQIIHELPIPFPGLLKQQRIVAKVDELMALCDRLEQQLHKKDSLSALLANAFVSAFTNITTGQQQKPTPPHP